MEPDPGGRLAWPGGGAGGGPAPATCGQCPPSLSTSVPPARPFSSYMPFLAFQFLLSYFCVLLWSSSSLQTYSGTFAPHQGAEPVTNTLPAKASDVNVHYCITDKPAPPFPPTPQDQQ